MIKFCVECRKDVEYIVKEEKKNIDIRGVEIEYMEKAAYCKECNAELYVAEINDRNIYLIDKAYREHEGIIQISQIKEIFDKYDIGKKPLAKLLGWGETTIIRYLEGQTPTKQYSDILLNLLNNAKYMNELIENNKDNITPIAYKKLKKSLEILDTVPNETALTEETDEKIKSVVNYILKECEDITHLALQKLLYYSQSFHKAFYNRNLFEYDCEAWVHGPVYRNVYNRYKEYGRDIIIEFNKHTFEYSDLTNIEKELLDSIIKNFGCYSGKLLEKMTHSEMPWKNTRVGLKDDEKSERIIDKNLIEEYFTKVKDKHNMLNIADIKDYSIDLFNKLN